jgi:hypothetical protein
LNVLSRDEKLTILSLLVEGNSLRSISRHTKIHRTTIINLLLEVGEKCRAFLDVRMRNLNLAHVECDEIWTFVRKKQGRLKEMEKDNPVAVHFLRSVKRRDRLGTAAENEF